MTSLTRTPSNKAFCGFAAEISKIFTSEVSGGPRSVRDGAASVRDGPASVRGGAASVRDGAASVRDGPRVLGILSILLKSYLFIYLQISKSTTTCTTHEHQALPVVSQRERCKNLAQPP